MAMELHKTIEGFRKALENERGADRAVGFVPTMGALHDGHISLVTRALDQCDLVAMSIFVNRLQFGPTEDLSSYPRPFEEDTQRAEAAGVVHLFAPSVEEMHPTGDIQTIVRVSGTTEMLEGVWRPGHFDGVTTMVAKLFAIVGPSHAYFGEKDWQQLESIRQMVTDLSMPVDVVGCPIVREPDGLAMSSRNIYLNEADRDSALKLHQALQRGLEVFAAGERSTRVVCDAMLDVLRNVDVQYAGHVGPGMSIKDEVEIGDRLLVAARVGPARLIDNVAVF